MAEMILPGTYIEVRPEGLMVPGRVTVGNLGVVGTASKGPVGVPVIIGGYTEARERFGDYDAWIDGASDELTLVRALELAYSHGATTVFAVRVASNAAAASSYTLASATGNSVVLTAKSPGTWGDGLTVNVWDADQDAIVEDEEHEGGAAITLAHPAVINSARNRIRVFRSGSGITSSLGIIYDGDPGPLVTGKVQVDRATGALTFFAGEEPAAGDTVTASYVVARANAVKVTLRLGRSEEIYTVIDGHDLIADIGRLSAWVDAAVDTQPAELPSKSPDALTFAAFSGGNNGESGAVYENGLAVLLNEEAHIIVAAGKDVSFGDELDAHCQQASTDAVKHDRIAVVGSGVGATVDSLRGHNLDSDRVIFVAPGIKVNDNAAQPPVEVTLPGAYAAAAVAGLLGGLSPHISLTNKTLRVGGVSPRYTSAELTQLVQSRVLALELRQGIRVVKGITTSTNTAWHQITTRRIVDYAKFGVRSAANPYIGLLNNERVRGRLRDTINMFLAQMVKDEMLIRYRLDVSATREEERQGIVQVEIVLQPVFSIDFIKVTMFLE